MKNKPQALHNFRFLYPKPTDRQVPPHAWELNEPPHGVNEPPHELNEPPHGSNMTTNFISVKSRYEGEP